MLAFALGVVLAVTLAAVAPAAASPAGQAGAGPRALVILPPGEGDTITLPAFLKNQASGNCADLGPHACDQLDAYRDWRFRDGALAPTPAAVQGATGTEDPAPGVQIVRDAAGIPHIYVHGPDEATIESRVAYGIGYAQAEDRLFQMEILRRAAEGSLSNLLGPDYLEMDYVTLRGTETDAERAQQIATLSPADAAALDSYSAGVNAVMTRDELDPSRMPAGLVLTQDTPLRPWTANDTLAVLTLEVKNVAESAGNEVGYGALARRLEQRYGLGKTVAILDDLQLTNDADTPVSVPHNQAAASTTDGLRYSFIHYTRSDTAQRIAALNPDIDAADRELRTGQQALSDAEQTLGLPVFGSNAWAISPQRSATGHALLWGGPQVGYYFPPVFDEMEIEGGPFHVRGVGVPGGGPGVVIGYTPHTAWTITTAQDDQVDTYVDRIRPAPGGGYEYLWRGAWRPVEQRTVTISSRVKSFDPTGTLPPPPVYTERRITLYRTQHGPAADPLPCVVFYLDANAGLSYCKVRAFWNRELQTGLSLVDVNRATDLAQFDRAVRENVAGFNFIYADDAGHIGYWHTGTVPVRPAGLDPRLPAPGDGSFDWRGYLDPALWPNVVDPAQGYVASWNNKPQASWLASGDGTLWGDFQRAAEPMALLAGHGAPFSLDDVWGIAKRTGELDLRDELGFKRFLTGLAGVSDLTPLERQAVSIVGSWDGTAFYPDGAERSSDGQPDGKVAGPAFPIFDAWFAALEDRVAQPVFGSGKAGVTDFTQLSTTTSPKYEFFDDYDAFLYDVMSGRAHQAGYLGGRTPLEVSRAALDDALASLSRAQGPDPSRWRAPMPQISFESLDVSDVPSIPWENRGTWGQAIALP